jgi:hypothetical protein
MERILFICRHGSICFVSSPVKKEEGMENETDNRFFENESKWPENCDGDSL